MFTAYFILCMSYFITYHQHKITFIGQLMMQKIALIQYTKLSIISSVAIKLHNDSFTLLWSLEFQQVRFKMIFREILCLC